MAKARKGAAIFITVGAALLFVGPVIWLLFASLSTNTVLDTDPLAVVGQFHFENYVTAFTKAQIGDYVVNSLFVGSMTALLVGVVATMAGYALAWLRLPARRLLMAVLLIALAAPVITYVIALSQIAIAYRLMNSLASVILVNAGTFSVIPALMIAAFFRGLPRELPEAARIDGASEWQTFLRVMVPLALPAILVAMTFAFVWSWNDILVPVVLLQSPSNYTIPQGVMNLKVDAHSQDLVKMFAAAIISAIPMVLVYRVLERRSVDSLRAGAVTG
jgi:ABC-type glycerol-3-phosphate transport system permease component